MPSCDAFLESGTYLECAIIQYQCHISEPEATDSVNQVLKVQHPSPLLVLKLDESTWVYRESILAN